MSATKKRRLADSTTSKNQRTGAPSTFLDVFKREETTKVKSIVDDKKERNYVPKITKVEGAKTDNIEETHEQPQSKNEIEMEQIRVVVNASKDVEKSTNCKLEERAVNNEVDKRRRPKPSAKLAVVIENFLNKQLDIASAPPTPPPITPANLPALQYWDRLFSSMSPSEALKAEKAVTELLLSYVKDEQNRI